VLAHPTDLLPGILDQRDPMLRLWELLDAGSLHSLHEHDDSGSCAVRGAIEGNKVYAYGTDATIMSGANSAVGCRHIADAISAAVRDRQPVIGLWHSGGARLADRIEVLDGVGSVFSAMIQASGQIPQISVVLGPVAGGAAHGPALTDLVIMSMDGRIFVTGPDAVRSVTGEQIDKAGLGGPDVHGGKSGVAHLVAETEADAITQARASTRLLAQPGVFELRAAGATQDLRALLPGSARRAYDVTPLIRAILDTTEDSQGFQELQPRWAPNIVIGLGRICGGTVGVIANNPLRKGGCLDSLSAEKAARFVRMCDSLGIPMLVMVDAPGYLPGLKQEWEGIVRRGAKLLHAFAESVVPRVTLVTRKAYGGAYIAMNSRALGATKVFAWPDAEIAVMGAEAAVNILHRKRLHAATEEERELLRAQLVREHEHEHRVMGVSRAVELGAVDEVIDPAQTRRRIAQAFADAPACRGSHRNIPL
jgi:acetyl-CoA/propionyl-CoA carboxylase carboxyl transferase subunit